MSALKFYANQKSAIWNNNPVLVQMLGLSPLFAISTTLVNGMAIALLTSIVLVSSSLTISACRTLIEARWRFALFLCVLAAYTTIADILLQRFNYPLHRELGIFVPLIACNFILLLHLENQAQKKSIPKALRESLITAAGYSLVIAIFSGVREWIIYGEILSSWSLLLPAAVPGEVDPTLTNTSVRFPFARLAPGALILFGLLLALRNALHPVTTRVTTDEQTPVTRARITGKIQPAAIRQYE